MYLQQQQQPHYSSNFQIDLEDKQLWNKFYNITNEMILTKAGRRTFPLIKLKFANLDPNTLYTIQIEFRVSDSFKYRFVNGEWRTTQRTEKIPNNAILYTHHESPKFGSHWVEKAISFDKLKLTNNENGKSKDAVFLRSLNKYDPIIHIYKHNGTNHNDKILVFSHLFKETQFIAVTAYQNDLITKLKVNYNPYAKAFKNTGNHVITIENDTVITTPIEVKKEEKVEKKQIPKLEYSIANMTQQSHSTIKTETEQYHQQQHQSNTNAYPNTNLLSMNSSYSQSDLFNWYPRYPIDSNTQQTSLYQPQVQFNQHPYKPYPNDTSYNSNNLYGFDYSTTNHLNNPYLYQQSRFYSQQFPYYQSNSQQVQQQQQHDQSNQYLYPSNNSSSSSFDSSLYSPFNDYYSKTINTSSAKRTQLKENRHVPYTTNRPIKRTPNNSNDNSLENLLPISPVYNSTNDSPANTNSSVINSKLDFNDNNSSDDSIASNELNYTNQRVLLQHLVSNQPQSSVSSVTSTYSTISTKTSNESGYYSHSPSSIALILDSAQQDTSAE